MLVANLVNLYHLFTSGVELTYAIIALTIIVGGFAVYIIEKFKL